MISAKRSLDALLSTAVALVLAALAATCILSAPDEAWADGGVPMHRLYNPFSGEHFYTADGGERNALVKVGWRYEGMGWRAPSSGEDVFRLYNPYVEGGDHHYTTSPEERDGLVKAGWRYEGVGWKSGGPQPLYRQYNPYAATGTHNYTADRAENDRLAEVGWREEGIGWYGEPLDDVGAYAAYYEKVRQLQAEQGEGRVEVLVEAGLRQLKGLCLVDLVDFDGDGAEELLLGYYDGSLAGGSSGSLASATGYRAQVWGYAGGGLRELHELGFQWTNGGFAYLPVYLGDEGAVLQDVEYGTDSEGRSTMTERIWALRDGAFVVAATFVTHGMWGTGRLEYEVDGEVVDEGAYRARHSEEMGGSVGVSYWMAASGGIVGGGGLWDAVNDPDATLAITRSTIQRLGGAESEPERPDGIWASIDKGFVFSSGAGAWSTVLEVAPDGTFTGYYHDSDMGDTGDGYPGGTRYETHFVGAFTDPVKTGDYEYSMQLKALEITDAPGEEIVDGVLVVHVTDSVYGLGRATSEPAGRYSLHLPGQALSAFSESAASWLFIRNSTSQRSGFYAIVNSSDPQYDLVFRTY